MNFWFIFSLVKKRNDVADIAWGLGFVILAWSSYFLSDNKTIVGLVVTLCVTIWGLRLSWHIKRRNMGKAEDYRYLAWRKDWGKWFYLRSYLQVYMLQGFFLYIIVLPVLLINKSAVTFKALVFLGLGVWLLGFIFEAIADKQLAMFIKNPKNKGKLMTSGLWAYSRHPNYFGESLQWWGIWLVAFSQPFGLLAIISPLMITLLLVKVSGIPLLEKRMSLHPDFMNYKKRVSVFIPWFPKQ